MKRKATAVWQGALRDGKGKISTASGVLSETQYGFNSRFAEGIGTNPEELIAAAHAGCFTMALSAKLGELGIIAEHLQTTAEVTLEQVDGQFSITAVHLDLRAKLPGVERVKFEQAAAEAKTGCPVSRLLNATITLKTALES